MKISLLVFMVILSVMTYSQDIPVTFQVDMSVQAFEGNFIIGTSNVVVRGDFQVDAGDTLGNWQGNFFQLTDADGDSIYTGTFPIPSIFTGSIYNFKYVITTPEQPDILENTPDRQFTLNPPSVIIPVTYFSNDTIPIIITEVTNTINFTADIGEILGVGVGGAFDPEQDSLLVMGLDWDNLGKNVIGNRRMLNPNPFNPGIYITSLTVTSGSAAPNGVGDSTKWKFKAYPDERFQNSGWEFGANRWHIYEADGSNITLPTIVPMILPQFPQLQTEVDFTLNVDMTDAVNIYNGEPIPLDSIEFVVVTGGAPFLGMYPVMQPPYPCYCIDDTAEGYIKALTYYVGNIWRYHTTIPIGQDCGIFEYHFGVIYPGSDTIGIGGYSSLWNELPFAINHNLLLTGLQPIIVINDLFGHPLPPDNVERIENLLPSDYYLEQNYPNPFNPTTVIRYSIPEMGYVTLKVFNLLGQEIEVIVNYEQPPGVYEATFDASELTSGVYFYTLQSKNFFSTKKMILLR